MKGSPTMADVARLAGVSVSAVSLVVRGKPGVGDETRARVLDAMRELGYQPLKPASGPSQVIALLVERLPFPELADQYYAEIVGGAAEEAQRLGCHLALRVWDDGAHEADLLADAAGGELAGILVGGGVVMPVSSLRALRETGVPLVLLDTVADLPGVHCVGPDNVHAAMLATRHLLDLGHRRIAFLPGPDSYPALRERKHGYLAAMAGAGLLPSPEYMPEAARGRRKGYSQMLDLLALPAERRPTAVVAVSDRAAVGALEALREMGVSVPEGMAVVGIDGIRAGQDASPALTTVNVPKREMGISAVRLMQTLLIGSGMPPGRYLLPCSLVVRNT